MEGIKREKLSTRLTSYAQPCSGRGRRPPPPLGDPSPPWNILTSFAPPERLIIMVAGRPKKSVVYSRIKGKFFLCKA